jgi:hypothetical protein
MTGLADWGAALREYMHDYNHWTMLGVLCELLPQPENRVTLADRCADLFKSKRTGGANR